MGLLFIKDGRFQEAKKFLLVVEFEDVFHVFSEADSGNSRARRRGIRVEIFIRAL